jgi:hypothetical protein
MFFISQGRKGKFTVRENCGSAGLTTKCHTTGRNSYFTQPDLGASSTRIGAHELSINKNGMKNLIKLGS